ncbi:MAG: phage tail sheath family protein [Acidobacteriaceae bacterium]|nr:phage tail sheath family protein [Acidobacteriaceae bacterium]MBV9778560.1 phage tail sheath family protein [Acidobacteriaceae bacterium]
MARAGTSSRSSIRVGAGYFGQKHPGVYLEREFGLPVGVDFWTGVPVFLGLLPKDPPLGPPPRPNSPIFLSLWSQFQYHVGKPKRGDFLAYAVRGFFENGGQECFVVALKEIGFDALTDALSAMESLDSIDLVCAPDLMKDNDAAFELQQIVVNHCETMGDRFAILDSRLGNSNDQVSHQWSEIDGKNGAIYYPWIKVSGFDGGLELVPPCGHVAGVYARTDNSIGVHKAPANEVLHGVWDLERQLTNADQDKLNPNRINCLRSFPGSGIKVWGARTLSGQPAWTYVNVRRIFLTAVRWVQANMSDIPFEPNAPKLWPRIERELTTYFNDQFLAGALKGRTPQEAFYVKCDAETNTPEHRDLGQVVAEIGLAPTIPYEFVVVRLIHGAKGISITGPVYPQ